MNVGYFQFLPKFLKVKNNLAEIEELLEKNKDKIKDLDLLTFPEYFLSGPIKIDFIKNYEKEMSSEKIRQNLCKISKKYPRLTFVMGSALLKIDKNYFNTTLVYKNGEILVQYNKKALIYNERHICQSDDKISLFKVNDFSVGIAVCWDLVLPEIFRKYAAKADLVIVPSFWGISGNALQSKFPFSLEKKYYTALGISRAYENAFALLFVNSVGKYKSPFYSDRMMGGSYFVLPPLGLTDKTNNKDPKKLHIVQFNKKTLQKYKDFYETDKDYFYYLDKKVI